MSKICLAHLSRIIMAFICRKVGHKSRLESAVYNANVQKNSHMLEWCMVTNAASIMV